MKKSFHTSLKTLIAEIEFDFLQNTVELKEKVIDFISISDVDVTFDIDKFSEDNYFIPDNDKFCYRIDDQLSSDIYSKFFLEKGSFINTGKFERQVCLAIKYILTLNTAHNNIVENKEVEAKVENKEVEAKVENKEVEAKVENEELDLFIFIIKKHKDIFTIHVSVILMYIIIKQLMKNKMKIDGIILKYTDICFKFGEAFIKFFIEHLEDNTIKNIFFKPDVHEKYYVRLLENKKKCDLFLKTIIDNENPLLDEEKNEFIIISLLTIFNIEDFEMRHNFYKMLRKILLYKVLEKNNTFPLEYGKTYTQYKTLILRFGSLILESFIDYELFIKKNYKILYKKKNIKTQLIIRFNKKMIDLSAIDIALQRPFLTKNSIKTILEKADDFINNPPNQLDYEGISHFHYLLLQYYCSQRTHNFISYNSNMTTDIKKSYLQYKENLTTKFVIDKDYLLSFLTLLKYHMLEKTKDIASNLNFEAKIKKHENIFLLYQIPIDTLLIFYKKYKIIPHVKRIFKNILNSILNYNLEDYILIRNYKNNLEILNQNEFYKLSNIERLKINSFINELFNKIFSYKMFMKNLIKECILYCNFRYFTVDCFIDSRGRCYYNGFYLNPQSYPITKAFVKLYNPTVIKNQEYSSIILPILKNFIINETYKNVLDKYFYSYEIYLKEQYKLKEQYLNSLLNINVNIEKDIIQKYKNIENSFELSYEILNFIKPHIKKIKKLYVVYSMFIRILFFRKDIQNYFELDATASGLQMTAILFQNRDLAVLCNLANNTNIKEDIYDQCSSFLIKNLDLLKNLLYKIFAEIPNKKYVKKELLKYYDKYLYNKIHINFLLIKVETLLGPLENLYEIKNYLEDFFHEHFWIVRDHKNLETKNKKKLLCYLILLRALKMNELRIEFNWLDSWIKSRDFCKKAIMTYGYNATPYRRKQEWLTTLLKLNNYEKRTDLFFITIISENLFNFITNTRLKPSKWLRELGVMIKQYLQKNIVKKELSDCYNLHITFENKFLKMKIHCPKLTTKRINIKGLESIRIHQLSLKLPKFIKKTFLVKDEKRIIRLIKEENYSLIARKFTPNFIHSMDAFVVHIFKEKLLNISRKLSSHNIMINHMTNHDNFSLTLEPFLKLILMDCYDILYHYDYIHTLNKVDFFSDILKYKTSLNIENNNNLLPGNFFKNNKNIIYYKPSTLDLMNTLFVK
jgi:hypothetical protein